jgi:hypothetical protein
MSDTQTTALPTREEIDAEPTLAEITAAEAASLVPYYEVTVHRSVTGA